MYLVKGGASNQNKRISVTGAGTTAQVDMNTPGNNFLIEIDRLVRPHTNVFLLKTDAEGHDGRALYSATKLLENNRVYTATLEFRPKSLREHGTDPVILLKWAVDGISILNTVLLSMRCSLYRIEHSMDYLVAIN
jgi:hypothetical protein